MHCRIKIFKTYMTCFKYVWVCYSYFTRHKEKNLGIIYLFLEKGWSSEKHCGCLIQSLIWIRYKESKVSPSLDSSQ